MRNIPAQLIDEKPFAQRKKFAKGRAMAVQVQKIESNVFHIYP
jgi:hypothetical protein